MAYKARTAYRNAKIVTEYNKKRFYSLKGRITDKLEKWVIEKALRHISLPVKSKILDLPCGTGRISMFLAKKRYVVTGGDISASMIKEAQGNVCQPNVFYKTNFKVLDAEKINCQDNYFDAIVSLRFFGHLPPDVRINVLKEFKRVGKRFFILAYYLKKCPQEILRRRKRLIAGVHWNPVLLKDVDEEFQQVGIKRIKVFPVLRGFSETIIVVGESFLKNY